jgi:hypothetical protein
LGKALPVRSIRFARAAAFEKALFVYPTEHLEMRQGARVIAKSNRIKPYTPQTNGKAERFIQPNVPIAVEIGRQASIASGH